MSIRSEMEQRYFQILDSISLFLVKLKTNPGGDTEKEYFLFIEQDAEKLLDLNNYGIINLPLFEKVRDVFKEIIITQESEENKKATSQMSHLLCDLYYIFKYVIENILFMIENEFLVLAN